MYAVNDVLTNRELVDYISNQELDYIDIPEDEEYKRLCKEDRFATSSYGDRSWMSPFEQGCYN